MAWSDAARRAAAEARKRSAKGRSERQAARSARFQFGHVTFDNLNKKANPDFHDMALKMMRKASGSPSKRYATAVRKLTSQLKGK